MAESDLSWLLNHTPYLKPVLFWVISAVVLSTVLMVVFSALAYYHSREEKAAEARPVTPHADGLRYRGSV